MDGESGNERLFREINSKTGLTMKCNNFRSPIKFPSLGELYRWYPVGKGIIFDGERLQGRVYESRFPAG